jgi:2-succinyl-6-hydroxy-2,4-cyclohexadiene-1-carboxylate synthase
MAPSPDDTGSEPQPPAASRPRVVLVHGFAQTGRCFGPLPDALESVGFSVVAPDLPGHGDSGVPAGDLAATAGYLLEGRAGSRPATYLGYSFGGRVCLRLAVDRPEAVRRLVLVSATAGIEDDAERAARREADERLAAEVEEGGLDAFLDRWLALPLFAGLSEAAQYRDERRRNTARGLAGSLRRAGTGAQEPLWDRLGSLCGLPVLVVTGARDRKFTALGDRLAAAIGPSARRLQVADAGHTVHLERPEAFLAGLLPWLAAT